MGGRGGGVRTVKASFAQPGMIFMWKQLVSSSGDEATENGCHSKSEMAGTLMKKYCPVP